MIASDDEPAMEQHIIASAGGVVYAVQDGDQYVYIYRESPPYRVDPFQAPTPVSAQLVRRAPSPDPSRGSGDDLPGPGRG